MNLLKPFKYSFNSIVYLLFPSLCEGCRKPLVKYEEVLCLSCEEHLAFTGGFGAYSRNDTVLRLSGRIPFRLAISLAYFSNGNLLQHLIHGLKYGGKQDNGIYLGKELGKLIAAHPGHNIDAIVPVPLHYKKEIQRGYNQSVCIAAGAASVLQKPLLANVVVRNRPTESQTEKTRMQRIENVKNAFSVSDIGILKGKHLLLIDDVLTTGATVEACAEVMLSVQGTSVSIATAGIAH